MYALEQIQTNLEEFSALELLAEVFTDIARAKLDRVRSGIERNRQFVGEIAKVLHVVRVMAEEKGLSAAAQKKVSASLVVTSNKRLYYGGLDTKIVNFYIAHTAYTGYVDRFVVGSVGVDILKGREYPFPYEPILFERELPNISELSSLAKKLAGYQKVMVYFPRFVTILSQQPSFVDVTGLVGATAENEGEKYYIFEPEIEKILAFFEEQVMAMLLEQTFLEAELARIGTQLLSMDEASQRAAEMIVTQKGVLARVKRQISSMRVLELAAGMYRKTGAFQSASHSQVFT